MKNILTVVLVAAAISLQAQGSSEMLEKAIGGVVTVAVYKTEVVNRPLGFRGDVDFPLKAYEKALDMTGSVSSGSGFIYSYRGKRYVITNSHVIENAADEDSSVFVFTVDRSRYEVKVLGGDSFYDIAVLEFKRPPGPETTTLEFKTAEARLGEPVFAIGNPLGEYPYSVSDGIISAKNRVIKNTFKGKFGFLQTTATIIWGNSGGPLVDVQGRVAGVNSQIAFAPSGEIQPQINFALEAALSERLVKEIIDNKGRVIRAYLGIEASAFYDIADGMAWPTDDKVRLTGVVPDSPAFPKLKDKIGGVIVAVNGENILSVDHLLSILEQVKPATAIRMSIRMDGKAQEEVSITAGELKTYELEDIAKFVLGNSKDLQLEPDLQEVVFAYDPGEVYGLGGEKRTFREKQSAGTAKFRVLAAGIVSEDESNIYKILNLRDLGAAIKLSSMAGVLDFCVVAFGDDSEDVKVYRYYLSGDEYVKKSSLYY